MPAASYAAQENPVSQTAGVSCTPVQCSVPVVQVLGKTVQYSVVLLMSQVKMLVVGVWGTVDLFLIPGLRTRVSRRPAMAASDNQT